jgi:hypothetical protein
LSPAAPPEKKKKKHRILRWDLVFVGGAAKLGLSIACKKACTARIGELREQFAQRWRV